MSTDPHALFPSDRLGAITAVAPITLGMSGAAVFAITTASGQYVLRVHRGDAAEWHRSTPLYRLAADAGVAPPLVHVDAAELCTVTVKIEGGPFGVALAQPDERKRALSGLARVFATLHATPFAAGEATDPILFARGIWSEQTARPGFPPWAMALADRIAAAETALARDPRKAFSHGDPNPANMLWDGARVWLVDWDRAGLAHPFLDLAAAANFLSLPDDEATALLGEQEGAEVSPDERALFVALRNLSRLIYGAVFLRLIPDLAAVTFAGRDETLSLRECFALLRTGKLDMKSATGLASIGAAFLAQ